MPGTLEYRISFAVPDPGPLVTDTLRTVGAVGITNDEYKFPVPSSVVAFLRPALGAVIITIRCHSGDPVEWQNRVVKELRNNGLRCIQWHVREL